MTRFWHLSVIISLLLSPASFAKKHKHPLPIDCAVCTESVERGQAKITCKAGHEIHGDCLAGYLSSMNHELTGEKAKSIQEEGIECTGRETDSIRCKKKIQLSEVEKCIGKMDQFSKFKAKLDEATAAARCGAPSAGASSGAEDPYQVAVREFKDQVESSFNLCCPGRNRHGENCGGLLAPIEGCNAAQCENCKTTFCYLCLERQGGSIEAHSHVRGHSGEFWEWRDGHTGLQPGSEGYTESEEYDVTEPDPMAPERVITRHVKMPYTYQNRYHWLLIRKKLEALFHDQKDEGVKKEVAARVEVLLRKNKLWPLPFISNHDPGQWIETIEKDAQIDLKNKIALLQNEFIYQNQFIKDASITPEAKAHAARVMSLVKGKLSELKVPILPSLDIGDTGILHVTPLLAEDEDLGVRHAFAHLRDHSPHFFALGGPQGELHRIIDPAGLVPPFILSAPLSRPRFIFGDVTHTMPHYQALYGPKGTDKTPDTAENRQKGYCEQIGATLPTEEQVQALKRAMGIRGVHNPNLIRGTSWQSIPFWSSLVDQHYGERHALSFDPWNGTLSMHARNASIAVRCVVPAPQN